MPGLVVITRITFCTAIMPPSVASTIALRLPIPGPIKSGLRESRPKLFRQGFTLRHVIKEPFSCVAGGPFGAKPGFLLDPHVDLLLVQHVPPGAGARRTDP